MSRILSRLVFLPALLAATTVATARPESTAPSTVKAYEKHAKAPSDTKAAPLRLSALPLYLSDRRALAILKIGDLPPVPVVFDTGTSGNALDTDFATIAKLEFNSAEEVEVRDGSTGNSFIAQQARVPSASLGGVPLMADTAAVYPYKEQDVVGIFGPNSFIGKYVVLDVGKERLIVKDKEGLRPPLGPGTAYFNAGTETALPGIELTVAGERMTAVLDTGNTNALLLPRDLATKVPLQGPLRVAGKAVSVAGAQDIYEGQLKGSVRVGPLVLENPTIRFAGRHPNVGLPLIRQLTIMLDPQNQRSWIMDGPSIAPRELMPFTGRFGNRTLRVEGGVLVSQVDGSTALPLRHLGDDLFANDRTGDLLQFRREGEKVTEFDLFRTNGTSSVVARSL